MKKSIITILLLNLFTMQAADRGKCMTDCESVCVGAACQRCSDNCSDCNFLCSAELTTNDPCLNNINCKKERECTYEENNYGAADYKDACAKCRKCDYCKDVEDARTKCRKCGDDVFRQCINDCEKT